MEIKTKSRGGCCRLRLIGADGDASQKTSFPSCHHLITNVMHCMTTTAITVQKAAVGRSRSPPLAVKNSCLWCPSLTLPKGRECQPGVVHILDVWGGWSMSLVAFRACVNALYTLLYMCLSAWVGGIYGVSL